MHLIQPQLHSRRAFLKRSGQLAFTGTALPLALNLAAMGEAAAFDATDYKALVCVFMHGGNDYANTVVTYDDPSYNRYSTIRGGGAGQGAGGIALAKSDLAATLLNPTAAPLDGLGQSRQYALHPSMGGLAGLFNGGHAAVQLNVGPLVVPLTRAQYSSSNRLLYPLPRQLFSHNDQQSVWQSSSPEGSTVGWGGSMGDLALSGNSNALFTCMSVTGNAVFLSGNSALQYQVSTSGAIKIRPATSAVYGSSAVSSAISSLIQQPSTQKLEHEYNRVTQRAMSAEASVSAAMTAFTASDFGRTLASNGDGSDHGWGGHHLVVGGAVNGKAFYGTPPPVSVTNTAAPEDQWHVGQGRLLPSTSVDQYAATLARWFGVASSELSGILPNMAHFGGAGYPANLGFLR